VYGDNVMAVNNVCKWCREFESGRVNVKDEQRSGQPSTSADPVQDFEAAVQTDRCLNTAQLELRFNLSQSTIWDFVHECLSYRKVFTSWVSHLTEPKKKCMGSSLMLLQ
jgi:transposase